MDATIEHKDVCRLYRCSNTESLGSFDIIGAVEELRASLTVQSLAELIRCAKIAGWDIIFDVTHIALRLASLLQPSEVWVDIGLASLTSEGSFFTKVN